MCLLSWINDFPNDIYIHMKWYWTLVAQTELKEVIRNYTVQMLISERPLLAISMH